MSGWIKIHRRLLDWEWSANPQMMALWVHLLLRANIIATEQQRGIERGEFLTSLRGLARDTGLTLKQVRVCLERLIKAGQIRAHSRAHSGAQSYTLITICKFDDYQCSENGEGTFEGTKRGTVLKEKEKKQKKEENIQENKKKEICLSKESHIKKEKTDAFLSLAGDLEKSICQKTAKAEFDLSRIDEEIKPLFIEFLSMRKKIGKPIKTQLGITGRFNKLQKLSSGNIALAKKIIQQSLEYEWQDFYALRSEEEEKLRQKKKLPSAAETTYSDKKYWN